MGIRARGIKLGALAILAMAFIGVTGTLIKPAFGAAGFNPNFLSTATTLPTGTPTLIQAPPAVIAGQATQRHYIQLQNDPSSSGVIYVCFCAQVLNYVCSSSTASINLGIGLPWYPPPVSLYIGMTPQQSGTSGIYQACDIQAIPATTGTILRALIE